jgi:peptidoglycan/xylan/chitin deacetylase (PgdA/CDA1 family)
MPIVADPAYAPARDPVARVARKLVQMYRTAPLPALPGKFYLSISFDDCPDSAATQGADILAEFGVSGTYYIATGLLGQPSPSGRVLDATRLRSLHAAGHEIALHSHSHRDLSVLPRAAALADIQQNRAELAELLGTAPSNHLAYPYAQTNIGLKRALVPVVASARGGSGGVNAGRADRMQLRACDLGGHVRNWQDKAVAQMKHASVSTGWVILFTHDIAHDPSPYGITPSQLRGLLAQAQTLGAEILPVGTVFDALGT